jgi:hypothetical protein
LLCLQVGRDVVDSYYLVVDYRTAEEIALELQAVSKAAAGQCDPSALSREEVFLLELLVAIYAAQNSRLGGSIEAALQCLAKLSIPLLVASSAEARAALDRDHRELITAPDADAADAAHIQLMQILNNMLAITWVSGRIDLLERVIATMMAQAYEHGVSIFAANALIFYASVRTHTRHTTHAACVRAGRACASGLHARV